MMSDAKKSLDHTVLFLFGIIILLLILSNIGVNNFFIQYIYFPLTIGAERSAGFELKYLIKSLTGEYKYFLLLIFIFLFQILKNFKTINFPKKTISKSKRVSIYML